MLKIVEKYKCCGCSACYNICPTKAIDVVSDDKGFKYPKIDQEKCIKCGMCENACPVLRHNELNNYLKAFACYNKNEEERLKSSSGGVFILLAKEILKRNGVVFGANLNKELKVEHIYVDKEDDLIKLMGSKYVQSNIGTSYSEAKKYLEQGKYVLFSGTPCQVAGLKTFLGKEYDKLYCQDLICHGVPSPKVWEKYKKYREEVDNGILINTNFRNKDNGWINYNLKFKYNNKTYKEYANEDIFMQLFLSNVILRDSCYTCNFKNKNRHSDITLADYWGVENIHPDLYDNKGISLVILHSTSGKELFDSIREALIYKETNLDEALKYNPSMVKSALINNKREEFFNNLDSGSFKEIAQNAIIFGEKINFLKTLNVEKIKQIYENLLDDTSKKIFSNRLMWELTGDKKYIREILGTIEIIEKINRINNRKMVIFGSGYFGRLLYKIFDNIKWECFVDNFFKCKEINGLKVISIDELKEKYSDAFVVISPQNGNKEIYNQLLTLGFNEESILNVGEALLELPKRKMLEMNSNGEYKNSVYSTIIKSTSDNTYKTEFNDTPIFINPDFEEMNYKILSKIEKEIGLGKIELAIAIKSDFEEFIEVVNFLLDHNSKYKFALRNYSLDKYDTILYAFLH